MKECCGQQHDLRGYLEHLDAKHRGKMPDDQHKPISEEELNSAARLEAEVRQLKEELKGMIDLAREYGLGSHEPTPQVAARLGYPDEWAP